MNDERDIIEETRKHLAENPKAAFLDAVAGRVMDAADEVERRIGPLGEKEYAAVVSVLADRAVMQIAESLAKRSGAKVFPLRGEPQYDCTGDNPERFCPDCKAGYLTAKEKAECPIGCTCIFCIPGA